MVQFALEHHLSEQTINSQKSLTLMRRASTPMRPTEAVDLADWWIVTHLCLSPLLLLLPILCLKKKEGNPEQEEMWSGGEWWARTLESGRSRERLANIGKGQKHLICHFKHKEVLGQPWWGMSLHLTLKPEITSDDLSQKSHEDVKKHGDKK